MKGEGFDENIKKKLEEIKGKDTSAESKENADLLKAYWGKKVIKQGKDVSNLTV